MLILVVDLSERKCLLIRKNIELCYLTDAVDIQMLWTLSNGSVQYYEAVELFLSSSASLCLIFKCRVPSSVDVSQKFKRANHQ